MDDETAPAVALREFLHQVRKVRLNGNATGIMNVFLYLRNVRTLLSHFTHNSPLRHAAARELARLSSRPPRKAPSPRRSCQNSRCPTSRCPTSILPPLEPRHLILLRLDIAIGWHHSLPPQPPVPSRSQGLPRVSGRYQRLPNHPQNHLPFPPPPLLLADPNRPLLPSLDDRVPRLWAVPSLPLGHDERGS